MSFASDSAEHFMASDRVRSYECEADGFLKPEYILHWIQEIAENHASTLGFGGQDAGDAQLAWVECRMDIIVHRRPIWKDVVRLETWTAQISPLLARRNTIFRDNEGRVLLEASCLWALIDIHRRRPVPLAKIGHPFPQITCDALSEAPQVSLDGLTPSRSAWIASRGEADFNRHINNATYLTRILETLPDEFVKRHELCGIHQDFKKECYPGDPITCDSYFTNTLSIHRLFKNDVMCTELILEWKRLADDR